MKRTLLLIGVSVGISVIALPAFTARDENLTGVDYQRPTVSLLSQFDANKNGMLDESERRALLEARKQARAKFDKNGDGWLNVEERAEARKAMRAKPKPKKENPHDEARRLIEWADVNADGRLDPSERAVLYQELLIREEATKGKHESSESD